VGYGQLRRPKPLLVVQSIEQRQSVFTRRNDVLLCYLKSFRNRHTFFRLSVVPIRRTSQGHSTDKLLRPQQQKKLNSNHVHQPREFARSIALYSSFSSNTASISTMTPSGNEFIPTALRVPTPASSPNTSFINSLQPLITPGCP